jgi:hypothetical protein
VRLTLPERVVPAFEVRTISGHRRLIRVRAPGARTVELMGDFTGWMPVILERSERGSAEWALLRSIPPGIYRLNLRVDGGAWGVPPGITALNDDFGPVGILKIAE